MHICYYRYVGNEIKNKNKPGGRMNNHSIIDIMENIITDPKDLQQFKLAVFDDIFKEIENESIKFV